jgi:hypothetical protein
MRADAHRKRRLFLLAVLCGACAWESAEERPIIDVTAPRLLDELCATKAYTLTGAAIRTAGLTEDSCGFELGPGTGDVTFSIDPVNGGDRTTTQVSALIVDVDVDGPSNARWVPFLVLDPSSDSSGLVNTVKIGTTDRRIGVVDLEVWSETTPEPSCSVARPRMRHALRSRSQTSSRLFAGIE